MDKIALQNAQNRLHALLPYIIAVIGALLSLALWYCLNYHSNAPLVIYLADSTSEVVLTLGLSLSVLLAVALRLAALRKEHDKLLNLVDRDFKQEMIKHKQAEETKKKLEKALLQGQKLQAIGTLAGGIAHDFNNILYAITGYTEMAREDVERNSLIYNNLGKVLDGANRGKELISRILTFSRRQQHDFKPLNIEETMESVLALLKPTIPASVALEFYPDIPAITILGNQTQLHQIIVNIVNNAVDAMDGEGTITITLSCIDAHEEVLSALNHNDKTNYCKIEITDTGHGMDPSTMERIFEPFYTTKEVGKGTGLGLATVYSIVKEHHGQIWVNSQLGHGTTFTLLLPQFQVQEDQHG